MLKREVSDLGKRLTAILEEKGINNIRNLEREAGLPDDFVRLLIKGYKETLDFEYGCMLAAHLGIPAEELAGKTGINIISIEPHAVTPRWYKMTSDLMEPTIKKDAFVLIDYGVINHAIPGLFLLELDGEETIRRGMLKSGEFVVTVDNSAYPLSESFPLNKLPKIIGTVLGIYKHL
jgi:hypothetical protein